MTDEDADGLARDIVQVVVLWQPGNSDLADDIADMLRGRIPDSLLEDISPALAWSFALGELLEGSERPHILAGDLVGDLVFTLRTERK